jgi:triacylglycerol esterase/lipase EstA (alpha/beta hydrolase family)
MAALEGERERDIGKGFMQTRGIAALAAALTLGACSHSSRGGGGTVGASTASNAPVTPSTTIAPVVSAALPPIPTYGTRKCWPIVLVHGFGGFKNIGPVQYWMNIPDVLRANGFEVFIVQDKAYDTIAVRAQEAMSQIVAQYPDPRVKINLIGHSMGGLDIRYMITQLGMGDRVASATTMGTPHHGSSVADVIFGVMPSPLQAAVEAVFQLVGYDITGGGKELTTVYCDQTFNPSTPDDPRVAYFSWTGHADPIGGSGRSILEPALYPTWAILSQLEGDNDGLVSTTSAQWGQFQGILAADHLNEVGQPFGITPTAFDYDTFYESWAEFLEKSGFGP